MQSWRIGNRALTPASNTISLSSFTHRINEFHYYISEIYKSLSLMNFGGFLSLRANLIYKEEACVVEKGVWEWYLTPLKLLVSAH